MAFRFKRAHIPDFKRIARFISKTFNELVEEQIDEFARAHAKHFRARIDAQFFEAFRTIPLSPLTIAKKKAARRDLRTMIATKTYMNSLAVWRKTDKSKRLKLWRIGFNPRKLAVGYDGKRSKLTLCKVAAIQEFGSQKMKIPARPHWRPHLAVMKVQAASLRRRWRAAAIAKVKARFKIGVR